MKFLLVLLFSWLSFGIKTQTFEWLNTAGGIKSDKGTKTVTDKNGNIFMTGYYNEEANFGPHNTGFSFTASKEAYVAKIDSSGNFLWVRNGLNYYDDRGPGLCVDPAGNVYVTGTCWGGLEWGSLNVYNSTSYTDQIFVVKLDTDGNEIWMKNAGVNEGGFPYNDDHGQDLIADDQGNIYLTGFISNNDVSPHDATFDNININVAANDSLAFLAKLSNDGVWQWVETFGGIVDHRDNAMGIDDEANLYVVGGFTDTKTFGSSTLTSNGLTDIYVVKYDSSGTFQWVQSAGGALKDRANSISYCIDGNMYVAGEFRDSCDFGTSNLNNYGGPNGRDIFVAQISKTAEQLSAGEILQVEKSFSGTMTEDVYFDMIGQKTASLIATSCELGAITTTKSNDDRLATNSFGKNLGIAFQIKDDLFDLLGKESDTGKNSGGDVKRNMMTLPLIYSKNTMNRKEYRALKKLLGTKKKSRKVISEIVELIDIAGGIDYSKNKLDEYSELALDAIARYPDSNIKQACKDLVAFNKNRVK